MAALNASRAFWRSRWRPPSTTLLPPAQTQAMAPAFAAKIQPSRTASLLRPASATVLQVFRPRRVYRNECARGLAPDSWTGPKFTYRVWPQRPGTYELELAVPRGTTARRVEIDAGTGRVRRLTVRPGTPVRVSATGRGALRMYVHVPPGPVGARAFGVRVVSLRFVAR